MELVLKEICRGHSGGAVCLDQFGDRAEGASPEQTLKLVADRRHQLGPLVTAEGCDAPCVGVAGGLMEFWPVFPVLPEDAVPVLPAVLKEVAAVPAGVL